MGTEFTVRRTTLDDVEQLVSLRFEMETELDKDEHHGVSPSDLIDGNRDYFTKQLTGFHFAAFFAEAEGRVIGTGGVVVYDAPPGRSNPTGVEGYIMNVYTVPEWRGRGVARCLLEHLVDHAYAEGARRLWLRASAHGRPVFEKYGFEAPGHYMQTFLHREEP